MQRAEYSSDVREIHKSIAPSSQGGWKRDTEISWSRKKKKVPERRHQNQIFPARLTGALSAPCPNHSKDLLDSYRGNNVSLVGNRQGDPSPQVDWHAHERNGCKKTGGGEGGAKMGNDAPRESVSQKVKINSTLHLVVACSIQASCV